MPSTQDDDKKNVERQILDIPAEAPSRGTLTSDRDFNSAKETEKLRKQKLQLAAGSAPTDNSTRPGSSKDSDGGSKNVKNMLRLAEGAPPVRVRLSIERDCAASNKRNISNRLRVAPGDAGEVSSRVETTETQRGEANTNTVGSNSTNPLGAELADTMDVEAVLNERLPNATAIIAPDENANGSAHSSSKRARLVFTMLFLVVVGGSIAAVFLSKSDENASIDLSTLSPTLSPTPIPTLSSIPSMSPSSSPSSRVSWIMEVLEPYVNDTSPWYDNTTVQFEALEWMQKWWWVPDTTDNEAVEIAIVERYAAIVVLLSLAGEQEKALFADFAALETCSWNAYLGGTVGLVCREGRVASIRLCESFEEL